MDFAHAFLAGLSRRVLVAPGIAASITFFMTVGKASPKISAAGDQRWPAGAALSPALAR
jgi:hypothetical protein